MSRTRKSSEGDEALNSSGAGARRLSSKQLERKEKFHGGPQERPSAAGPVEVPPSSSTSSSMISVAAGGGGEGLAGGKARGRRESGSQHEHKRRKEEEGGGSLDSRSAGKKRKRDQVDDEPPPIEAKKPRTSDPHHHHPSAKEAERGAARSREGGGGGAGGGGVAGAESADSRSSVDRKRRHDSSIKDVPPPKKHLRSRSPDTPRPSMPTNSGSNVSGSSSRRHERHGSSSRTSVTSPNNKKPERHHRVKAPSPKKTEQESVEDNESVTTGAAATTDPAAATVAPENVRKKLDWTLVSSYTKKASTKLARRSSSSALDRFSPGALFTRIGVSPSLAGKEYFGTISELVSAHLKKTYKQKTTAVESNESSPCPLPSSLLDAPFEGQKFASSCVSRIKEQLNWEHLIPDNLGPCRRALTASADYTIRKKLRKANQVS